MRWFPVFLFSLFVDYERSFAAKCVPSDTVDISWIADYYKAAAKSPQLPVLEYGDRSADQFQNLYAKSIEYYGRKLMINLQDQAIDAGKQLIKDLRGDIDRLEESINSNACANNTKQMCIDSALKKVTNQLHIFLNLNPGNAEFEHPVLPPLPTQVMLESRAMKLTPKDIFLNFELTINTLSDHLFKYITYLYLIGWTAVRTQYETIRLQLCNGILNRPVLNAYRMAVDKVWKQRKLIQENVSKRTWKCFEDAGDCIIAISNNCNASNDDQD